MISSLPLLDAAPSSAAPKATPPRSDIPVADTWAVETMYAGEAEWEADFARIDEQVKPLEAFRGRLNTADTVGEFLRQDTLLDRLLAKVYVYAHLRADQDTSHAGHQALNARARSKWSEIDGRMAWATPELLANDEATLRAWSELPALAEFRYPLQQLLRRKPHTLSVKEETLLARAGECSGA